MPPAIGIHSGANTCRRQPVSDSLTRHSIALNRVTTPAAAPLESAPRKVAARKDRAPRLPEALPVIEEVIDPEPVKAQPEQWRCIGQEVSEQLYYEPGRFLRRRIIRRKYVQRTAVDAVPVIAPLPECLQERGIAAPGLLAHVLISKYCDHSE